MLPGFCISLFRPHRHPGIPAAAHPARAHRAFLSRRARTVSDHSANPGEAHPRISGMGRRLCAQPQDPGHEGRKRREQGGLCPPASAAYGASESTRGLLHLHQHGDGQHVPLTKTRFPTEDPDYRIIRRVPSRFLHYYFYIRDPVIGPLAMCVGAYLPFQTTYYLNGHNFMDIELRRQGVAFRKDDNAFLATADPKALQAAADQLSASILEKRLNYWS